MAGFTIRAHHLSQSVGAPGTRQVDAPRIAGGTSGLFRFADQLMAVGSTALDQNAKRLAEQKELHERTWAADRLDRVDRSIAQEVDRLRRDEDLSDPAVLARFDAFGRDLVRDIDGAQEISPAMRQLAASRARSAVTAQLNSLLDAGRAAGVAKARDNLSGQVNRLSNQVRRDPASLEQAFAALDERIALFDRVADADATRDVRAAGRVALVESAVGGRILTGDFDGARELVEGGAFDADLTGDQAEALLGDVAGAKKRWLDAIEKARRERAADQRDGLMQAAASQAARARETGRYDPEIFDRIEGVLGADEAAKAEEKAIRAQAVHGQVQALTALPPAEAEDRLADLKPDPRAAHYADRDTYAQDLDDWKQVAADLSHFQRRLADDPAAAVAPAVRREMERFDALGGGDEAERAAHEAAARAREQRQRGVPVPRMMTNAEADRWVGEFQAAAVDRRLALLTDLTERYGARGGQAVDELAANGLPPAVRVAARYAHSDGIATAREILAGMADPNAKEILPNDQEFKGHLAAVLAPLYRDAPQMRAAVRDAATAIYVARASRAGYASDVWDGDGEDLLEGAIADATGGILEHNGRAIDAPYPGADQDGLERALDGIEDADLAGAAWADGTPVTAEELREDLTLASLGGGQYALMHGDQAMADARAPGRPFVLDLAGLWPDLTRRDPARRPAGRGGYNGN